MPEQLVCKVCFDNTSVAPETIPEVRVNIRSLRDQRFHVWRCSRCQSLHTYETVDLAHYYKQYAVANDSLDPMSRLFLRAQRRRLEKAGVKREHSILDYGCGNGKFVRYMREKGYTQAFGYDFYVPKFNDSSLLERRYDVIFSQDVLEHVEDPWELLESFNRLLAPGGLILIGTPNATAIDLRRPEDFIHALHVPYHRHILSQPMLMNIGKKLDWDLVKFFPHSFHSTFVPFLNYRFLTFYMASWDNTVDTLLEPLKPNLRLLFHPLALFYALFGGFFPLKSDCQIMFRRRSTPS
jgi:2-polyprenyl-3-methyl-5-hydroxy-6-metoxy-1,4-benzoquinol methylase